MPPISKRQTLADEGHPLVQQTAARLTEKARTDREKLDRLFHFVRDEIAFGFPADGDLVPASETLEAGFGQCNTKATLLLALCKAAGLSARIHFSLIAKEIQRGFFTGIGYWLMPEEISHAWIEVEIDGAWRRIDGFINDLPLHEAAERELAERGWDTGFSLALSEGHASASLNIDREDFEQMAAVTDDHGAWDEPADYDASPHYRNRPGWLRLGAYRVLIDGVNRRVQRLRSSR